jgi:superfamily I DNA and RNA helicase
MQIIADEKKLNNDALALLLIRHLTELNIQDSLVYYNFPFYRGETTDDLVKAHVLFVSKEYGVIFFRCLDKEVSFTEAEKNKLDQLDGFIFAKINKHEEFRLDRRVLKIELTPCVFVQKKETNNPEFVDVAGVNDKIQKNKKKSLSVEEFKLLIAVVEGTSTLRAKKDREVKGNGEMTKGKVLSIIQSKHAVFDLEQKRAALNIIDSPQRIRGLAGSGKTIILTMKAALYHLDNPDAEILYTYFTKALYGQIKYLIEKYYRDFSENREPNWKKIHIWHGWGGAGLTGVYSDTCLENTIERISFPTAKRMNPKDPFSYVCEELDSHNLKQKFELTLIDEGQDFPKHFYRVCRKITKQQRIVWAYDDFQNIFDVDIQDEKETFGKDQKGKYYVDFSREENQLQDIVLHRCYRNPRIALIHAFALGLGIYNDKVLQRLENNKHWQDLGFDVEKGDSRDHEEMIVSRPKANSPSESNEFFNEDSVQIAVCNGIEEEADLVASEIEKDVKDRNLRADDICVVGLDGRNIGRYFDLIEERLIKKGIGVFNILNAPNNNILFSVDNKVTLSTINKAKGNEAGMVYIVGVDEIFAHKDYVMDRNKLFTAITRTKGWVTITGTGKRAEQCFNEMRVLKKNGYKLIFKQPSKTDTRTILRRMDQQQSGLNEVHKGLEVLKNAGMSNEEIQNWISQTLKGKK